MFFDERDKYLKESFENIKKGVSISQSLFIPLLIFSTFSLESSLIFTFNFLLIFFIVEEKIHQYNQGLKIFQFFQFFPVFFNKN